MRKVILFAIPFLFSFCASEAQERKPSASEQVIIPGDSVYITGLDRYRKIRLYLPKSYNSSDKSYPVLYMHDGQNLFDDVTSYVGEWGIDETLDSLSDKLEIIVVGIDNGQAQRMTEYGPWDNSRFGKAEGPEYVKFLAEELKPMIDDQYRTLPDAGSTGIMGSSMGGLISHYAMVEYPDVFGMIGIFSPSYWYSEEIWDYTKTRKSKSGQIVYMLVGGKEGGNVVNDVKKMEEVLISSGFPASDLRVVFDDQGEHNEKFWRKYTPESLLFLFSRQK